MAYSPLLVLLGALILIAICMSGLVNLRVETAPLRLWVEPDSMAARDKAAYDTAFGPFYRIEQIILSTPRVANGSQSPILTRDAIELVRIAIPLLSLSHERQENMDGHWL